MYGSDLDDGHLAGIHHTYYKSLSFASVVGTLPWQVRRWEQRQALCVNLPTTAELRELHISHCAILHAVDTGIRLVNYRRIVHTLFRQARDCLGQRWERAVLQLDPLTTNDSVIINI